MSYRGWWSSLAASALYGALRRRTTRTSAKPHSRIQALRRRTWRTSAKSHSRARVGHRVERAAGRYLRRRGLRLITRNFLTRRGEIDLVMRDGATLVFVEVRYRSSTARMQPYESVGHRKRQRLLAAGKIFVARHGELGPIRFDVVSVTRQNYHLRFDWIRGAFPD